MLSATTTARRPTYQLTEQSLLYSRQSLAEHAKTSYSDLLYACSAGCRLQDQRSAVGSDVFLWRGCRYTVYKDHITLEDYEVHDGMGLELYYN